MTPTPDAAHETTIANLEALIDWTERDGDTSGEFFRHDGYVLTVDDLRRAAAALRADNGETVESTEYRVTTTRPDGEQVEFAAADFQAQFWAEHGGTEGWPPALVECRTVTTVTSRSGWRPVDTGGER